MSDLLRVLLVEDNPGDVQLIRETLSETGPAIFQVESVSRLSEALARLEGGGIDLVMIDLGLPDSQGLETFHALRRAAPDIPAVVLTRNDDQERAVAAVREGAQDYLIKGQIGGSILARAARYAVERKRAQEALRKSERLNRSLVEHLPQRIFIKDPNSVYLSCNANYARDLGIAPEQIVGKDDFAFYPRELAEAYRADDQTAMTTGTLKDIEERYQVAGQERWVHTVKVPFHDEQGHVVGVLGIFEDITERKKTEESRRLTQFSVDIAGDAVLWLGPDASFSYANDAVCRLLGYSREELLKMTAHDVNPAHPREVWPAHWQELKEKKTLFFEAALRRKDGRMVPVEITANYIEFEGKAYNCAFVRDITERKRAEEARRESEEKFRTLVERANDGVIIIQDAIVKYANPRMAELDGSRVEQIVGTPFTDHVHPTELSRLVENYQKRMRGEPVPATYETVLRRRDGSPAPAELNAGLIMYQGRPADMVIIRDITERKRAEEKSKGQYEKLRRWHEVTLDREGRIAELKREVNELAARLGEPPKYGNPEG